MKTKKNLLGIIIPIMLLALIASSGCGSANSEFKSVEDYKNGKLTPGWYYDGMSAEEMKKYIDGMTDSQARQLAIELFRQKYVIASTIPSTTSSMNSETIKTQENATSLMFGTIAVSNEISKNLKIGADWVSPNEEIPLSEETIEYYKKSGLLNYDWVVGKKSVIYPQLVPGVYKTWFIWRGKKKDNKTLLYVGLQTKWFIDREVNGTILVQR